MLSQYLLFVLLRYPIRWNVTFGIQEYSRFASEGGRYLSQTNVLRSQRGPQRGRGNVFPRKPFIIMARGDVDGEWGVAVERLVPFSHPPNYIRPHQLFVLFSLKREFSIVSFLKRCCPRRFPALPCKWGSCMILSAGCWYALLRRSLPKVRMPMSCCG